MGEQLAAGLYAGLWESPRASLSQPLKGRDYLGAGRTPSQGHPSQQGWGQGASAGVLSAKPWPYKPLGREGSPGWKPCPQPSSCQAQNHVPHKSAPHHAPLGLSPLTVQAPGPLGGWSAEGHARGCARTGLTQGRPRDEVRRPGRGGGHTYLAPTACRLCGTCTFSLELLGIPRGRQDHSCSTEQRTEQAQLPAEVTLSWVHLGPVPGLFLFHQLASRWCRRRRGSPTQETEQSGVGGGKGSG